MCKFSTVLIMESWEAWADVNHLPPLAVRMLESEAQTPEMRT